MLSEAGWRVHFSPSFEGGKKAAAGVGAMWREDKVQVHAERIKDPELQEARLQGMVERYIVDVGWPDPYAIYNIYGKSGGSGVHIATTEAMLGACRRDMRMGVLYPSIVLGDFNATPNKLGPVKDWVHEEQWTDVGHRADWWGSTPNHWTCHARAAAKKSRIDGILVDAVTLATIHGSRSNIMFRFQHTAS